MSVNPNLQTANQIQLPQSMPLSVQLALPSPTKKKKKKKKGRNRTLLFYTEEVSTLIKDMPGRVEDVVFVC